MNNIEKPNPYKDKDLGNSFVSESGFVIPNKELSENFISTLDLVFSKKYTEATEDYLKNLYRSFKKIDFSENTKRILENPNFFLKEYIPEQRKIKSNEEMHVFLGGLIYELNEAENCFEQINKNVKDQIITEMGKKIKDIPREDDIKKENKGITSILTPVEETLRNYEKSSEKIMQDIKVLTKYLEELNQSIG